MEMIERSGNGDGEFGFVELLESGDVDIRGFLNLEEEQNKKKVARYPQMYSLSSCLPFACYNSNGRMVYFGGEEDGLVNGFPMNPNVRCGIETSSSTSSSSSNSSHSKHKKKEGNLGATAAAAAGGGGRGITGIAAGIQKKPRKEQGKTNKSSAIKKEKLSDRIIKLQQLVSPFGKSDTASVLHEALCYIKFLHDQVQVLSSPYLQHLPSSAATLQVEGLKVETPVVDLRSRELCLVPIACIAQVPGSNGADLWSPVMGSTAGEVDPKC